MKGRALPLALLLLIITRFVGIAWGYPFLLHPDERNMADAISRLTLEDGLNPHFFAYGQLPLYLVWIGYALKSLSLYPVIDSWQAALGLRILSATASVVSGWIVYKLLVRESRSETVALTGLLFWIATPVFIQFAHFGTTESLLALLLLCALWFRKRMLITALVIGLAIGIKISAVVLLVIPLYEWWHTRSIKQLVLLGMTTVLFVFIASPHYFFSYPEALSSLTYESNVGRGITKVFYTYQFEHANRLLFPFVSIFPYALGLPLFFVTISQLPYAWKHNRLYVVLLLVFILTIMPLYTQWTRFYVFVFVMALLIASTAGRRLKYLYGLMLAAHLVIGLSYLNIYLQPDTRISASLWVKENLKEGSSILTESANVILVPFTAPQHSVVTELFLFDSERNPKVVDTLKERLSMVDYVVVPSRRIFANYTCVYGAAIHNQTTCKQLEIEHPTLHWYYSQLLGNNWREIARFETKHWGLPDEFAEETWSVFDHPVVRIYERKK